MLIMSLFIHVVINLPQLVNPLIKGRFDCYAGLSHCKQENMYNHIYAGGNYKKCF
jgi:hypothetical protein